MMELLPWFLTWSVLGAQFEEHGENNIHNARRHKTAVTLDGVPYANQNSYIRKLNFNRLSFSLADDVEKTIRRWPSYREHRSPLLPQLNEIARQRS
jgi:hypothetical protein